MTKVHYKNYIQIVERSIKCVPNYEYTYTHIHIRNYIKKIKKDLQTAVHLYTTHHHIFGVVYFNLQLC